MAVITDITLTDTSVLADKNGAVEYSEYSQDRRHPRYIKRNERR